jgi:hypothetical protein
MAFIHNSWSFPTALWSSFLTIIRSNKIRTTKCGPIMYPLMPRVRKKWWKCREGDNEEEEEVVKALRKRAPYWRLMDDQCFATWSRTAMHSDCKVIYRQLPLPVDWVIHSDSHAGLEPQYGETSISGLHADTFLWTGLSQARPYCFANSSIIVCAWYLNAGKKSLMVNDRLVPDGTWLEKIEIPGGRPFRK